MEVREVMTPRVDVVALSIPVTAESVARAARESGHSSFPVVHNDLDDVVGVLFVNDLFRSGWRSDQEGGQEPSPLDISRRLRQPYLLPESLNVLDALVDMRRQRRAFAFVVDEYGGVGGGEDGAHAGKVGIVLADHARGRRGAHGQRPPRAPRW